MAQISTQSISASNIPIVKCMKTPTVSHPRQRSRIGTIGARHRYSLSDCTHAPSMAAKAEAVAGKWGTLKPALSEATLSTLVDRYKFPTMTPVQAASIPLLMTNKDICVEVIDRKRTHHRDCQGLTRGAMRVHRRSRDRAKHSHTQFQRSKSCCDGMSPCERTTSAPSSSRRLESSRSRYVRAPSPCCTQRARS